MISFTQVTKKFGDVTALENISFKINPGEFVFIIGPSGSGKTTLFRLILKEFAPTSGSIEIAGINVDEISRKKIPGLRKNIGVVFQDLKLLPDQTVFENVALALKLLGRPEEQINEEVMAVLEQVGLKERADFFPAQLAGGELQRTCIARAIVAKPDIILADEPTGNLDIATAKQIIELLKKINQKGKTILMATHNFEIVNICEYRVIELDKGKLISDKKKGKYHSHEKTS